MDQRVAARQFRCGAIHIQIRGLRALLWAVVIFSVIIGIVPVQGTSHGSASSAPSNGEASAPVQSSPAGFPTSIRHVITVVLENENTGTVLRQGAYEKYLAATYGFAPNYYAVCHPSVPNYFAMTAGLPLICGSDNYHVYKVAPNIGDLVEARHLTWASHFESMPSACDLTQNTSVYTNAHNPFVQYADIYNNKSRCDAHVSTLDAWNSTVANGTLPNYAFVVPNKIHDGHNTNTSVADAWLKAWLPPLVNSSLFRTSVFLIVYDEAASDNSGYNGTDGGLSYFAAVGPAVNPNSTYRANSSHYNLLATTEWLLGLGGTGRNDSSAGFPAMKSLFSASYPEDFRLAGSVTAQSNGTPLGGSTVVIQGDSSTTADSGGGYSFLLTNGSYLATASEPGYVSQSTTMVIAGHGASLNFSLQRAGAFELTGTVTASATGAPIVGARVTQAGGGFATTSAGGHYHLALANGTYNVLVTDAGYQALSTTATVAGANVTRDFAMKSFLYAFGGAVTNGSGLPIAGASVTLGGGIGATTDATGHYSLQLANGTYPTAVAAPGYQTVHSSLTITGSPQTRNFRLLPVGVLAFTLAGTVMHSEDRSPISGAQVLLYGGGSFDTGPDGQYTFLLPNGTYRLSAWAPGRIVLSASAAMLGNATILDFPLEPFAYSVSGIVTTTETGAPVAGANVTLSGEGSILTDPSGSYAFGVPNGSYTLQVDRVGFPSQSIPITVHGTPVYTNVTLVSPSVRSPASPLSIVGNPSSVWLIGAIIGIVAISTLAIRRSRRRSRLANRRAHRPDGLKYRAGRT
jgi:hypothetical protein